ncbi:inner nuclear membrane protein MAN1, partial [Blyttiomyces helicus]
PLTTTLDDTKTHRLITSTQPPILSYACRIRRTIWETSQEYWAELVTAAAVLLATIYGYHRHQIISRETRVVARLVDDVLDAVHEESENHRTDPIRHPVPGLSTSQLRDHLLPGVVPGRTVSKRSGSAAVSHSVDGIRTTRDPSGRTVWYLAEEAARDRLWGKVQTLVLRNSNVRETSMELNGEQHLVWQWIGSHALSPRR